MLEAGERLPGDDAVLARLGGDGPGPAAERRERLADALANFDSATITTTHGFCQMMLNALGVWGDVAPGAVLLEDPEDLVEEVVDDLLARHALVRGTIPVRRRDALRAGLDVVRNPGVPLARPPTGGTSRRRAGAGDWPTACAPSSGAACWTPTSSPTTTCWCGWPTPSAIPGGDRPPVPACAGATASSWSTSSRTPTRCSGGS